MPKIKTIMRKISMIAMIVLPLTTFALFESLTNLFTPDVKIKLMFTGDIFFDRHMDEKTQMDNKRIENKYSYPFSGLSTLNKENFDAWIGNLECPVTEKQSTTKQKEVELRFSCKKEYLPNLAKYFDAVSIANNHTDNMGQRAGIEETRKHLDDAGIKYFGDYDNSQTNELCKIIYVKNKDVNFPIVMCGYHGVFSLPTDQQLAVIKDYSKYFITFVMPHQGVEYTFESNKYQKLIYKKMIDNGADAVFGSHPHVVQEVENYKGKLIFYSLGNFIFDQAWSKTREHMEVATDIDLPKYKNNYKDLNCENISNIDCLAAASKLKILKPDFTLKYKPIFTDAGTDFITKKTILTDKEYTAKLKSVGFDKVYTTFKD